MSSILLKTGIVKLFLKNNLIYNCLNERVICENIVTTNIHTFLLNPQNTTFLTIIKLNEL